MGILLALFKFITCTNRPFTIIAGLLFGKPKHGFKNLLKFYFVKKALDCADKVIVYSSQLPSIYANIFNMGIEKFVFLPIPARVTTNEFANLSGLLNTSQGYIFSGGRSDRDYETLIEAIKAVKYPLKIACGSQDYSKLKHRISGSNSNIYVDLPLSNFIQLMARADIIVIPLNSPQSVNGQLVMLHAMSLAKPIIMTRSLGANDYIKNWINGVLFDAQDTSSLITAIKTLLKNRDLAKLLAFNAFHNVNTLCDLQLFINSIVNMVER